MMPLHYLKNFCKIANFYFKLFSNSPEDIDTKMGLKKTFAVTNGETKQAIKIDTPRSDIK